MTETLRDALNRLAGTTALDAQGAANVWAGTTNLDLVGALNVKNGGTNLELAGVLNALAGTTGLEVDAAASAITVAPGGGAWSPLDLTGLVGWWDPSDATTITESGGAVSQIDDKSGEGNHLSQSNADNKPGTGTRTIGDVNVLAFNGDRLDKTGTASLDGVDEVTIAAVIEADNNQDNRRVFAVNDGTNNDYNQPDGFTIEVATSLKMVYNDGQFCETNISTGTPYVVLFRKADSGFMARINGTEVTEGYGSTSNGTFAASSNFRMGDHLPAGGAAWIGAVGEVLFYAAALTDDDCDDVENYLATKYGITVS